MNNKQQKSHNIDSGSIKETRDTSYARLKLLGSIALFISVVGVLLATGGQFDFIGHERPSAKPHKKLVVTKSDQPKYSFYEDLKKRKTELNTTTNNDTVRNTSITEKEKSYRYIVQIGAFSHKRDANKITRKAKKLGFRTTVIYKNSKYVAQTGPFKGKKAAVDAEIVLQAAKLPTLIRRLP